MKLYTEEQVRQAVKSGFKLAMETDGGLKEGQEECINSFTPIELPSDEDIEERAESYCKFIFSTGMLHGASNHTRQGYIQSAKWMKEQILNQKNK